MQMTFTQFKGFVGALDPKKLEVPHVIAGQNFIVDHDGPKSWFGYEIVTYAQLANSVQVQDFVINGEYYLFNDFGVFSYDTNGGFFFPHFIFSTAAATQFPWSRADVGGVHYFARQGFDLISFNPTTGEWKEHPGSDVLGIPSNVYAVTSAAGRLIILWRDGVSWSAFDDGLDLVTDVDKGIGAQSLVLVGNGEPLGIKRTADGFMTFTKSGIMKSEAIDSLNPFRHYELIDEENNTLIPIDQFCILQFDERTCVFLTRTGFFRTSGRFPEPWQLLFSEFLTRKVFSKLNVAQTPGLIKLSFDDVGQLLFVSITENDVPFVYDKAYVLYTPKDDWGIFNRRHISLLNVNVHEGPNVNNAFGFICGSCYLRRFYPFPNAEGQPDEALHVYFSDEITYPARLENDAQVFSSYVHLSSINRSNFNANMGLYNQSTTELQPKDIQTVNSYVDIGLFRLLDRDYLDRINYVTNVFIGMLQEQEGFEEENWDEINGIEEDWDNEDGEEDWGFLVVDYTNYDAELIGTADGFNVYEQQQEELTLVDTQGASKLFACNVAGWYLMLRLKAQEADKSFHLKFLQLTGNLGGRF